jgi:hypothetical protein
MTGMPTQAGRAFASKRPVGRVLAQHNASLLNVEVKKRWR